MTVIRAATLADVNGIAEVHVASWRSTYPGIVPDSVIRGFTVERRRQQWEAFFEQDDTSRCLFVTENDTGRITGFAAGGPQRDEDHPAYEAELYAIYLLETTQRCGTGRKLMQTVARQLARHGFTSMLVWVLAGNPAQQFYERMGGIRTGEKTLHMGNENVIEIAYGWPQLAALTSDH